MKMTHFRMNAQWKRAVSLTLCLLLLASVTAFSACSGKEGGPSQSKTTPTDLPSDATTPDGLPSDATAPDWSAETTVPADVYLGGGERFTLLSEQSTVAPGGEFTVTLRAESCKNVACFDVLISASPNAAASSFQEKESGEFITSAIQLSDGVNFTAIVASTSTIDALDMVTVSYTVSADAKPGDTITVTGEFTQYLVGTDESGDMTADATELVSVEPLTLTVA